MKTAIIIHWTWGNPEWNWFPWMKRELEARGYQVFVPHFPTPKNQSLENWKTAFEKYKKYLNQETIFIAHSVWPAFVLDILETLNAPIKACYFVAGFLGFIQIPEFDVLNETITAKQFNWEKIHKNCNNFYMCHGSNDPYVPLENAQKMAQYLWVEIDVIENGGHLNEESGYTEFEYLLEKIKDFFVREKYEEIISSNIYLSLATVDSEFWTWISPVFFCRDKNYLYFASQDSSRHIKNIQKDSRITFSIFDSRAPEWEGNGIQGIWKVKEISHEQLREWLKIYTTDFLSQSDFESWFYSLFCIEIQKAFILNPFWWADERIDVKN